MKPVLRAYGIKLAVSFGTLLFLLALGPAAACRAAAGPGQGLIESSQQCLRCHGTPGIVLKFKDGQSMDAYVDADKYATSVHGSEPCATCHKEQELVKGQHARRNFRSKIHYRVMAGQPCRRCHPDALLRHKPVHAALLDKEALGNPVVCTDCHGAHSVSAIVGGQVFASEEKYCLNCHASEVTLHYKDGQSAKVRVDTGEIKKSPHANLSCSDCHFGFTSEAHPRRSFRSARDHAISLSEVCKRCHFDKYTKLSESIHFQLLSQGRTEAPVCTDCHGGHASSYARQDRLGSVEKCRRCHSGIYVTYSKSVHGSALIDENNTDVPTCIHCHTPHSTVDPTTVEFHERIPELCSNCHSDGRLMRKYGLSTEVVKTYLSDFHGMTVGFYKKEAGYANKEVRYKPERPIAVCTDCHGVHNITKSEGPSSTVLKANLLKRCQGCHKEATANFPDAWLSHYEPNMKSAPAVFFVNMMYKITMPLMVAGLLLQVFLHIWRYMVNR